MIGFFGLAQVGGRPMDEWLRDVIENYKAFRDADSFARYLAVQIESSATSAELSEVPGFHIGTFENRGSQIVPTFTFLRNVASLSNGSYSGVGEFLPPEEQLWGATYRVSRWRMSDRPCVLARQALGPRIGRLWSSNRPCQISRPTRTLPSRPICTLSRKRASG